MRPDYYDEQAESLAKLDAMPEPKRANGHAAYNVPVVSLCRASEVKMEPISWLWDGWLACGKLHVLAGVPGLGKTTLSLALAATISKGGLWPDGSRCREPGNVLIWSGEDGIEDTLAPRLAAMGADVSRLHFVKDVTEYPNDAQRIVREFDPAQDMPRLIAAANPLGTVRLLVIDPVSLSVAGDSNKNSEVRRGLAPLTTFAEQLGAAVIGISHFSKGTAGKDPLDRVTGSLAFGAAPRIVLGAARISEQGEDGQPREGGHVLVRIKSNIGPSGGAIEYQFDQVQIQNSITASRIVWGRAIEGNAREILANAEQTPEDHGERTAVDEAKDFLRSELSAGPVSPRELAKRANEAGIAWATVRRAKDAMGVIARKGDFAGGWVWEMRREGAQRAQSCSPAKNVSIFGANERLRTESGTCEPAKMLKSAEDAQGAHGFSGGADEQLRDREAF